MDRFETPDRYADEEEASPEREAEMSERDRKREEKRSRFKARDQDVSPHQGHDVTRSDADLSQHPEAKRSRERRAAARDAKARIRRPLSELHHVVGKDERNLIWEAYTK